jgi:hypothetical protein
MEKFTVVTGFYVEDRGGIIQGTKQGDVMYWFGDTGIGMACELPCAYESKTFHFTAPAMTRGQKKGHFELKCEYPFDLYAEIGGVVMMSFMMRVRRMVSD